MALCSVCGKKTTFGQNRPWSRKATKRQFKANLQKISVYEDGRKVQKVMCTRCVRTLAKTPA
jgi:large subunit ribosomal protein L28